MDRQIQQKRAATRLATYIKGLPRGGRPRLAQLCTDSGEPCAASYLHQIASGRRKARPGLVRAIVAHSDGQLSEEDGADYSYDVLPEIPLDPWGDDEDVA